VTAGLRADRLERLLALAAETDAGAVLLTRPEYIYYLVGVEPPAERPVALLVSREGLRAVWPDEVPADLPSEVDCAAYPLRSALAAGRPDDFAPTCARHLAFSADAGLLVDAEVAPLVPALARARDGRCVLQELVRRKGDDEVEVIAANLAANDRAFAVVERELRAGTSDYDVMALCLRELSQAAGGPVGYDANIGLGELGGTTEAQPGGAVAREGSTVFVDLYPRRHHYVGDSTRAFAVGYAEPWALEAHARLEAALEVGERMLVPGARAADIDAATRAAAAIRGESYPHHTGHGLGLRAPEPPFIVPGSDDVIRVGDVVAIEPGHYVAGVGGMRLEDVFLVTDAGARVLNNFPRRLTICS
jgi:Xaa-Pro aminopeptidase